MSKKINIVLDAAILIVFLVVYDPKFTGQTIHEWLSLALAAASIAHIVLHWDWIIQMGGRYFKKLWHSSRLNFAVDALLFVGSIMLMLSGILISKSISGTFGLKLNSSMIWKLVHSTSAEICVVMVGLHFALHWKWVLETVRRYLVDPIRSRIPAAGGQVAEPVVVRTDDK